ncbi:MAG: hypothetical protein ABW022_03155, partial [Actinoplanes sp.]
MVRNSSAPVAVLLRLIEAAPVEACEGLQDRSDLPAAVQEAMARHAVHRVRATLAGHPRVEPRLRRLLLADPEWQVAVRAFGSPGQPPLSDDELNDLLGRIVDPGYTWFSPEELWDELWTAMGYGGRLHRLAAVHPDPRVRRHAARSAGWIDASSRDALLADPEPEIRAVAAAAVAEERRVLGPADLPAQHGHAYWAALQRPLSRAAVDQVLAGGDAASLSYLGPNPSTPPDVVEALLRHDHTDVRRRLAGRSGLTREQLLRLAADPEIEVRTAVSVHPGLTERDRAGIAISTAGGHYGSRRECRSDGHDFVDERVPPLDDALRWADSVNPLLRRRAARHPELPVRADDPDLGVRVLAALHNPGAPPSLVLRCYLEYDGCGRRRLSTLPQFPTDGLAAHAGHPDPAVRRLAALDPHADPALIDRLRADPDPAVRQAVAECPRLPAPRIVELLDDPELAEHAAANPALP